MSASSWSANRPLMSGLVVLLLGLGGFSVWSVATEIDGAVVAAGQVAVEARRQSVQHPDGGLVVRLHVREGSTVKAGDPILTLDGTELIAQQALARRELVETFARLDRLATEIRGTGQIAYRDDLGAFRGLIPDLRSILADETALFEARRATLRQTAAQLRERQVQTEAVIAGREKQLEASRRQHGLIRDELSGQENLLTQGLTEMSRVLALRREAARLKGTIGELEAGVAEARSAIAGFELERLRQEATFREAAQSELRNQQPKEAELRERLRVIETKLERLVLRAPMNGTVLGLQIHTIGGVVAAGTEIASIIPTDVPLILSVEVDPSQIDRVRAGQPALIRFPNFNTRTTPELNGTVAAVSADTVSDPVSGRRFYLAELALQPGAKDRLGNQSIVPGMPVEAFIRTDARTPASFLFKPLADYWAHAMREE